MKALLNTIKKELFSEVVGYKTVLYRYKGQLYRYDKPVMRVMSDKVIAGLLVKGFIGAVACWAFLVLLIGSMPVNMQ